jgi:uncharacterized protein with HEPN domain
MQGAAGVSEGQNTGRLLCKRFSPICCRRKLMIIGEAISQAFRKDPSLEEHIPQTRKIVDFRNILVHGYYAIQNETVWGVLQKDVPILLRQVDELLGQK